MFAPHFPGPSDGTVEESVKDPRIIKLCDKNDWLLITTDSSMHKTHTEVIKTTSAMILATAHNSAQDMGEWVEGLIKAKAKIERHHKKTQRPWCGTFTRQGEVHVKPFDLAKVCRRTRPREMEGVAEIPQAIAKQAKGEKPAKQAG
jgi:hypothetical protein